MTQTRQREGELETSLDLITFEGAGNVELPWAGSDGRLGLQDLRPGDAFTLDVSAEGRMLTGTVSLPSLPVPAYHNDQGVEVISWTPVPGAASYLVVADTDSPTESRITRDTSYVLRRNQLPSYETNCIEDWETKLDAIIKETIDKDMTLISGIPPWVQMYFDRLSAKEGGKKIKDIFKNFSLFVYGGVNYEPYRAKLEESIGKRIDSIETYPASEGFIAYQDRQHAKGMRLALNDHIFFEFVPLLFLNLWFS